MTGTTLVGTEVGFVTALPVAGVPLVGTTTGAGVVEPPCKVVGTTGRGVELELDGGVAELVVAWEVADEVLPPDTTVATTAEPAIAKVVGVFVVIVNGSIPQRNETKVVAHTTERVKSVAKGSSWLLKPQDRLVALATSELTNWLSSFQMLHRYQNHALIFP